MLLTEVGLDSGGRLVTIRSLFEVRNSTTHPVRIVFNPDPRHKPVTKRRASSNPGLDNDTDLDTEMASITSEEVEVLEPGDIFQIPTLLLEKSLQMSGSHLGCIWLCPNITNEKSSLFQSFRGRSDEGKLGELQVSFCSRPIQLAKIVHETSLIFQNGSFEDVAADDAKSGVQVSCPTRGGSGDGNAPFCYAIEVGRSPIISANKERVLPDGSKDAGTAVDASEKKPANPTAQEKKTKKQEKIHGPVAYTLSIHAPLVIVNLLPEGGRFELMHAVRKTVLWYADLQPGQQIPVHSVGLDAPLLLLVNLGFCRTPVGEGALVHHGADTLSSGRGKGRFFKACSEFELTHCYVFSLLRPKCWIQIVRKSCYEGYKANRKDSDRDVRFSR